MQNPYTTLFGKVPVQLIPRDQQASQVVETFQAEAPSQQVFFITGPRGSGKTVFMTGVERMLEQDGRWVVEELSIEQDLLGSLVARLNSRKRLSRLFAEAQIDLSLFGLGMHVRGAQPIADYELALSEMLGALNSKGKRLLVTIDEVVSNSQMRAFASSFQMLVRKDLPVFLLMTGLYENIESLQNEKSLTFLYRAPKIKLAGLGIRSIASNYKKTFGIDWDKALKMARLTSGYSFAFQLLGYLVWEAGGLTEDVLDDYRAQLYELSYDKIWAEMSQGDRNVAHGIALAPTPSVKDARDVLGMLPNQFSPYRRRLMNKGIVDGSQHGVVRFTLPLFRDYVLERYGEDDLD